MEGPTASQQTREKGRSKIKLLERGYRNTHTIAAPFHTTRLAACILSRPSFFYCLKKSNHDQESLYPHTIRSFASSKSTLELQRSRETPKVFYLSTEGQNCGAALTLWYQCEPSTAQRDSKTGGPACYSRHSQMFLYLLFSNVCQVNFESSVGKGQRISCELSGEQELIVQEAWILRPILLAANLPPATSWVVHRADPKRSPPLPIVLFKTEKGHWIQGASKGAYVTRPDTVLYPLAYLPSQLGL